MDVLSVMKKEGFKEGSRLELTLFEGAEYYDGYTSAPTWNTPGYEPTEEMTQEPGLKMTGYIARFEEDKNRVVLASTWDGDKADYDVSNGPWYVDQNCIHSFNR